MTIIVFFAGVTGNLERKKYQDKIFMILESKKIPFEKRDITVDEADKTLMRSIVGDPKALAPQICNGETYCGDMHAFDEAIESKQLEAFLKI